MKINYKQIVFSAIGFFSVFFIVLGAKAATIISQEDFSTAGVLEQGSDIIQSLGSTWSGQQFDTIILKIAPYTTAATSTIILSKNAVTYKNFTAERIYPVGEAAYMTYHINGGGFATLSNGDSFSIEVVDLAGNGDALVYGSSDSSSWPGGSLSCGGPGHCPTSDGVDDAYFIFKTSTSSVSLNGITNGGTYSDFINWDIALDNIVFGDLVKITYYISGNPTSTAYVDQQYIGVPYSPSITDIPSFQMLKGNALWYPPLSPTVDWVANVDVYESDGTTLVATTGYINFTISGLFAPTTVASTTSGYANATSSQAFQYDNVDCSGYGDLTFQNFGCQLRKAGSWLVQLLFVPTRGLDAISSVYASFKQVFPFSIFYGLTDTFQARIENPSSTPALSLDYTWETPRLLSPGGSVIVASSTDTINFSNDTTLSSLLGDDVVEVIFNGILLVAIMVMIYVIYRLIFKKS